jgi:quinol monooxygenase YgiN
VRMTRGMESPSRFVLLVEWESVAAHEGFRGSDGFDRWRAAIGPFLAGPPVVEHVADI